MIWATKYFGPQNIKSLMYYKTKSKKNPGLFCGAQNVVKNKQKVNKVSKTNARTQSPEMMQRTELGVV